MNSSAAFSVSRATTVGANILCAWALLNILPGVGSLVFIALGHHAPAVRMLFAAEEIETLDRRALAAIDGVAILANTLIVVYFDTAFFVVLWCLRRGQRWSFFVMAGGVAVLQVAGYISDHLLFLGKNIMLLNISSLILLVSLGLCARPVSLVYSATDLRGLCTGHRAELSLEPIVAGTRLRWVVRLHLRRGAWWKRLATRLLFTAAPRACLRRLRKRFPVRGAV